MWKKINKFYRGKFYKIKNFGYPRHELITHDLSENPKDFTIMYIPRFCNNNKTNNPDTQVTSFFEYKNWIIDYPKQTGFKIILRPHPLAFDNYVKSGALKQNELDDFLTEIKNSNKIILFTDFNYFNFFKKPPFS